MSKRYSSRKQEQYFQPCHLRVGAHYYNGRADSYHLVFQNMLTHKFEQVYVRQAGENRHWGRPFWIDKETFDDKANTTYHIGSIGGEPGSFVLASLGTKAKALSRAKQMARERNWPFDLQSDVVRWAELLQGPVAECLVCGEHFGHSFHGGYKRSYEPVVCPACKKAVAAYNALSEEVEPLSVYRFALERPGSHYGYHDADIEALRAIIAVACNDVRAGDKRQSHLFTIGPKEYGRNPAFFGETAPWRIEALREAIERVNGYARKAYAVGLKSGSNLLRKLRDGEMHPNDFSDIREGK